MKKLFIATYFPHPIFIVIHLLPLPSHLRKKVQVGLYPLKIFVSEVSVFFAHPSMFFVPSLISTNYVSDFSICYSFYISSQNCFRLCMQVSLKEQVNVASEMVVITDRKEIYNYPVISTNEYLIKLTHFYYGCNYSIE